ncbi:MAG: ABC transporter ATP-binding protein [Deltaproteobacteria bacterium]|nr:ABC transporter ATP-binding protein [Deltaproteobacteria bacterium]
MATPLIEIDRVTVDYRIGKRTTLRALDCVSLDARPGELLSVIGPSGCGKSTLLHLIGGLLRPTGGEVRVGGARVTRPLPDKIALVFQQYTLFPWRTVKGNVEIGLEFRGVGREKRERIASRELEGVGLLSFQHFYPRQISGGMKQRVAIARALSLSPDILLMDEPFGALDEQTRMVLGEELVRILERTQKTIFFVTHSLTEATYLSDRIAVMTARPGCIKEVVEVDLPHPRVPRMMTSDRFNQLRNLLFELLHDESIKALQMGEREGLGPA